MMENLNQPQKQSLSLDQFLDKMASLSRFLDSAYSLTSESKQNIQWYCDYRAHQYYQRYTQYLQEEKEFKKRVVKKSPYVVKCTNKHRSGAGRRRVSKTFPARFDS
jgi:hypothetical protein